MAEDKIQFKYEFANQYVPVYSNGCIGGKNCRGEVVLNFYTERVAIPDSEEYVLNEDKTLGNLIKTEPRDLPIIRTVSTGVIMTKDQAREFHAWLGRVLDE